MTSTNHTAGFDILYTSDLHGAIRPIHYNTNAYRPAGLALLASLIRKERERSPELMLVDNGDLCKDHPWPHMLLHRFPKTKCIHS